MLKICMTSAASLCVAAVMSAAPARADYPERPIRVIALNPPGGVSDTVARTVGERLAERVGQPVIVDNRVAANGIVGSEIVAKAPPDGHTLLLGFVGNLSINPGLFRKLPYDSEKDFAPISLAARSPIVVVANPALPVTSIKELVSLVKGQPSKYAYASSGNGNGNHLATELLATMTGMQLVHVPYKGGPPALTAVIQGEVSLMLANSVFAVPQVKAGRVKALAVTTAQRLPILPDVPTVTESGVADFVVTTWFGFLAPAGTPKAIVHRLNAEIASILSDPNVRSALDRAGLMPESSTPEEFGRLIRTEKDRWSKIIKLTNAKPG